MIDDDIERRLGAGIRRRAAGRLAREIERADPDARRRSVAAEELESARARQADLQEQVERCRNLLAKSRRRVGFEPEPFRDALSCSLEAQRARVAAELKRQERQPDQLALDFSAEEKRQLQANMAAWRRRLSQFDAELEREPARVRAFYEVQATRIEPVGLVYLWPETN